MAATTSVRSPPDGKTSDVYLPQSLPDGPCEVVIGDSSGRDA
jgi:hypothetical protein